VEVELLVEAQGDLDGEGEVDVVGERRREAEPDGGGVLGLDLAAIVG
jgi:hypothetical protein